MWDLSSQTGIEPLPPAEIAQNCNHWTTREVPLLSFNNIFAWDETSYLRVLPFISCFRPQRSLQEVLERCSLEPRIWVLRTVVTNLLLFLAFQLTKIGNKSFLKGKKVSSYYYFQVNIKNVLFFDFTVTSCYAEILVSNYVKLMLYTTANITPYENHAECSLQVPSEYVFSLPLTVWGQNTVFQNHLKWCFFSWLCHQFGTELDLYISGFK